jgi:hypothetical protein
MPTRKKRTTDAAAPLDDPWFEDTSPIEMPEPKQTTDEAGPRSRGGPGKVSSSQ